MYKCLGFGTFVVKIHFLKRWSSKIFTVVLLVNLVTPHITLIPLVNLITLVTLFVVEFKKYATVKKGNKYHQRWR